MKLHKLRPLGRHLMERSQGSKNKNAPEIRARLNKALHAAIGVIDDDGPEARELRQACDAVMNMLPPTCATLSAIL